MSGKVTHLEGSAFQRLRGFSPAIVTEGGKMVWLSGQTSTIDPDGTDISWEFDAQVRSCYALIEQTLKRAGGNLGSLVYTTTYILDPRHGERLVDLLKEIFPNGKYPCSAQITVAGFARPGILVEIQGIGVVP
jgi:2-iminobutanoate/2-iminopropanoate deaminase